MKTVRQRRTIRWHVWVICVKDYKLFSPFFGRQVSCTATFITIKLDRKQFPEWQHVNLSAKLFVIMFVGPHIAVISLHECAVHQRTLSESSTHVKCNWICHRVTDETTKPTAAGKPLRTFFFFFPRVTSTHPLPASSQSWLSNPHSVFMVHPARKSKMNKRWRVSGEVKNTTGRQSREDGWDKRNINPVFPPLHHCRWECYNTNIGDYWT